jgi:pimeloyl-ACP methyl ester carboxylesterase
MTEFHEIRLGSGHKLAYQRTGTGDPILLVHGITTWGFLWEHVAHRLSATRDVVVVDLLGCGRSDKPVSTSYALAAHADRMLEVLDALGWDRADYVGHDLGGGIGQILAVRHPERVRSLTLINTVAHDFWPVQPIIALRTPVVRQLLMATFDAGTFRLVIRRGLYHRDKLTPALLERFREPLLTEEGRRGLLHFARCLDNADLTTIDAELRQLQVPTTVVWGMADLYLSFAIAQRLVSQIPGARLVRVDTAGHFSPIDEPELIADAILDACRERP